MTDFAEPSFGELCRYASFSAFDSEVRLWSATSNCSQNEHQLRMLPLKRGTSMLGSLTPSASVVEVATVAGLAGRRRLAFREHLYIFSHMLFSSFIRSSSSGRSSVASSGATLLSADFRSAISSSSCCTVHSSVGSVDRVSLTVDSLCSS